MKDLIEGARRARLEAIKRSSLGRCVFALVASLLMLVVTRLTPFDEPMILLGLPIVIAAYVGGLVPGLIATVTSVLGAVYVLTPELPFAINRPTDVAEVGALLVLGTIISAVCESLRGTRRRADASLARTTNARAELHTSDERLRELAANIDEVFWLSTPDRSQMLYISPAYEKIWGQSCASLYARPSSWVDSIHESDRAEMARVAATGSVHTDEHVFRIVRPDRTLRWIHTREQPIRDAANNIVRLVGVATDITNHHALEDQLRQAQKMESLGMLAGGIAHDFNNLLSVISTCNSLLGESIPASSPDRELVDDTDDAVTRAVALTRQLLAFSRKQVSEPVVLDLNAVVKETRKMLRRMVGDDVILNLSLDPELARVRVDPGYLVQVIMNLAVNARDAMPRGGTLELVTRTVQHAQLGRAVELAVTDTGCGMAEDVRARVFEPFFTTKERGKGTGMGLAVVHGIVDQANGKLEVESQVGVGTAFRVYLPAIEAALEAAADIVPAISRGVEAILLVDDDDYVRRSAARALRSRGFTVEEASDGNAALRKLEEHTFDLLITDVVMPNMDGRELVEAAHGRWPDLEILYMSGYTDDAVVRHGVMRGETQLIEKPFRVDALAARARAILDAREPVATPRIARAKRQTGKSTRTAWSQMSTRGG